MKIASIVGARPQFVKLAPFSKKIREKNHEIIIHTGQHYDVNMSASFFKELDIPNPDYHLEIGSDTHAKQTGKMLAELEDVFVKEQPELVVVFGDTNSTLAGALAAAKLHIPILHIEAGLRSFNRRMPEEINRVATDHISSFLYAPTEAAMINLSKEGLEDISYLTGDIMVDSLKLALEKSKGRELVNEKMGLNKEEYYLLTLHRPQNVDNYEYLSNLLKKMNKLDLPVIFPVHPRTRKILRDYAPNTLDETYPAIRFIEPVGYLDFINLQANSKAVVTDSGGIQKEAYILKRPCVTVRTETEWIETVNSGWNKLLAPDSEDFIEQIIEHRPLNEYHDLFGQNVAAKMSEIIDSMELKF
ncbi:MAG: UDP-N-acetylglucosamine 2-epimerase (non-hydrolyzing) [Candidatus Cloacimonas sp.]|nr:UDP-N-acetylglucosamine 2-epimerase (non-hydrolyzing) [Candidatus Cloacimonadota bacterium]